MKRKALLSLVSASCLMIPTCLSIDTDGLLGIGGNIVCEVVTGGFPGGDYIDYCSVIDIDLGADLND